MVSLAALGLLAAPQLILSAPREATMGFVQKIFYYHVPSAMTDVPGRVRLRVGLGGSISSRGSERGDQLAASAAELTVLFGLCTLVTGPLWARKAWGVWWQWDVRLTTTLLLWFIFIAYLFARKYGGPGARTLAAGLALFGAADVPLIYFSVSHLAHHPSQDDGDQDPVARHGHPVSACRGSPSPSCSSRCWKCASALERARARVDELHLEAEDGGMEYQT